MVGTSSAESPRSLGQSHKSGRVHCNEGHLLSKRNLENLHTLSSRYCTNLVEVEANLRPKVSRPVCPGVRRPSGTRDQFFFLLEISFRQLRLCYFVEPSLKRGRVCNLLVQLLLGLARAVTLGSKPCRTHGHILLSHLRLPPTWRARSPYLYPPGTGRPSYTLGHWVPFLSPLKTRRDYGGGILTRLHTGGGGY
jgi:hypothetical protein